MNAQTLPAATGLTPVRLLVWGVTDADRARAIADARSHHLLFGHRIAVIEEAAAPIPAAGDTFALAHHAEYDRTWAAYRLNEGA